LSEQHRIRVLYHLRQFSEAEGSAKLREFLIDIRLIKISRLAEMMQLRQLQHPKSTGNFVDRCIGANLVECLTKIAFAHIMGDDHNLGHVPSDIGLHN